MWLLNIDSKIDDMQLVETLIEKFGVATIPGAAFGMQQNCYLRLSYGALSDSEIEVGLERLKNGLGSF